MSFYIRDISSLYERYFKTNADLLVSQEYNPVECFKLFNNVYIDDESSSINKIKKDKRKYYNHNKDLLITNSLNIEALTLFAINNKYKSIELLISNSFLDKDIDKVIVEIISHFEELEISVGVLLSNSLYIEKRKDFLEERSFYISRYIPDIIDTLQEEDYLKRSLLTNKMKCLSPVRENLGDVSLLKKVSKEKTIAKSHIVLEESFKDKLIKYMNNSHKTNTEIYNKGGITRKLFSKILSEKDYIPRKETICCLIVGMELCLEDALDLLNSAGYTLTNSILFDVIIKKYINRKDYDINSINAELDENGLTVLGWKPRDI